MLRALAFLVKVSLLLAALVWFSQHPGSVEIRWMGRIVEASLGFIAALLAGLLLAWTLIYRLWRAFVSVPAALRRYRASQARERGYVAITSGLVAIAAGDAASAEKQAKRALSLVPDAPLAKLLTAQTALLQGDHLRARHEFQALLENEDTAFIGLRGLLNDAILSDNHQEALTLIRRAEKLQPKRQWVLRTLFDMETRNRDWTKALETLKKGERQGVFDKATAARQRQAILCALGEEALRRGDGSEALRSFKNAADLDGSFPPPAILLARTALNSGKRHLGLKYIMRAWEKTPHPDLAEAWGKFRTPSRKAKALYDEGKDAYQWMKQLFDLKPAHRESQRMLGAAALEAGMWREARAHLMHAADYRALAKLERAETGDEAKSREWLEAAADNPPDPKWVCASCGHAALDWQALCRHCGAFCSYEWITPALDVREAAKKIPGLDADLLAPPGF